MKKIIILAAFFCVFTVVNAQETIKSIEEQIELGSPRENVYYKDVHNTLDKYIGTWVFDDGTHYLKIEIEKKIRVKHLIFKDFYEDTLFVKYQYKLNEEELYNTIENPYLHIYGNTIFTGTTNEIVLSYGEPSLTSCERGKTGSLTLEYVDSGTMGVVDLDATLNWSRETDYGLDPSKCPDGTEQDSSDFLIPANLTLSRE